MNIYLAHGCKRMAFCVGKEIDRLCNEDCPDRYTYRTCENTGKLVVTNNKLSWYKQGIFSNG